MQLYLIRHGEIAGDPHRQYPTAPDDLTDCLSETGQRQAAALAEALRDVRFDRVFASTLGRAIQTAQPLARQSARRVEPLPWLIEWQPATVLGECDETQYEAIQEAASKRRPEQCWKTPAGEGALEMAHRVIVGFLNTMETLGVQAGHGGYLLDDPEDDRRIAMVAHGGSLGVLAAFLLGILLKPHGPIAFQQTGVAVFSFMRRVDVWYPALQIAPSYPATVLDDEALSANDASTTRN